MDQQQQVPYQMQPQMQPQQPYQQQPQQMQNTTVVVQAGGAGKIPQNQRDWHSGICGCFDDIGTCCLGYWCPCILACTVTSKMNESCCVPLFLQGGLMAMRVKIRTQHGITGSICCDWCVTSCCPLLSLCQMDRELNRAGV